MNEERERESRKGREDPNVEPNEKFAHLFAFNVVECGLREREREREKKGKGGGGYIISLNSKGCR